MDALKFNLRQEHVVICDFVSTFHQVRATAHSGMALPGTCSREPSSLGMPQTQG